MENVQFVLTFLRIIFKKLADSLSLLYSEFVNLFIGLINSTDDIDSDV